jgi:hypothetical protein
MSKLVRAIEQLESRVLLSVSEPNNVPSQAIPIVTPGGFGGSFTYSDYVGDSDSVDYYRVDITASQTFTATLTGLGEDLNLQLIQDKNNNNVIDSGEVVTGSHYTGTHDELISLKLYAGTYFVRVYQGFAGANSNYSVTIKNDTAGDTAGTPRFLSNSAVATVSDGLDDTDLYDVYQLFTDPLPSSVTFSSRLVSTNASNYHVDLIVDRNHNQVFDSGELLTTSHLVDGAQVISTPVTVNGWIFVRVLHGAISTDNYTLRIQVDSAGNSIPAARNLGSPQSSYYKVQDEVSDSTVPGFADDVDFYKVPVVNPGYTLDAGLTLDPSLDRNTFTVKMDLIKDANNNGSVDSGEVITTASTGPNQPDVSFSWPVAIGTYFIRVTGSPYPLYTLELQEDRVPGFQKFSQSEDLGSIGGTQRLDEALSLGDSADAYRFTLAAPGTVQAKVNSTALLAGIYTDSNHDDTIDFNPSGSERLKDFTYNSPLKITLPAGTYLIYLEETTGPSGYTVTLSADLAGDSPDTARTLGTLGAFKQVNDGVAYNPTDVDWYKFSLSNSQTFSAEMDLFSSLYANTNVTVTLWQDVSGTLTQLQQGIATSEYLFLQRNLSAGSYELQVSTNYAYGYNYVMGLSTGDQDDSIPEVRLQQASQKDIPGSGDYTLSSATDVDLIAIYPNAGQTIAINIDSRNGSNVDTYVRLFDSTGKQIAFNNDGAAPGEAASKFSYLTYTFTTSGDYFFGVSSAGNNNYNASDGSGDAGGSSTGQYHFSISLVTAPVAASVAGTVFNDANGNGIKDSGEPGMSGRTVWVDIDNDKVLDSNEPKATTDLSGNYKISDLAAGAYIIRTVIPSGWTQTLPSGGYGIHATVTSGQALKNQNFGTKQTSTATASIAGNVFHDFDRDGFKDSGDSNLSGWTVWVDLDNDKVKDSNESSAVTDSNGNYKISGLAANTYIVRIVLQSGWVQTLPTGGYGFHATVSSGQNLTGANFGVDN